jgi:hypothetical protein
MAAQIPEPRVDAVDLDDWSAFVARATQQGGGFMCLMLSNMNNSGAPRVLAGSRFEINGAFYRCTADEDVGGAPANNVVNYVYATSYGVSSSSFFYSNSAPTFDPAKGGWYGGAGRAVAKFFYVGGQYNGKVILDSCNAMSEVNTEQTIPASGGLIYANGGVNNMNEVTLPPGAYRVEVKGGAGGDGGSGGSGGAANETVGIGGAGAAGEAVMKVVYLTRPTRALLYAGGDGADGENGGNGKKATGYTGGGGGGGSTGGVSRASIGGDDMTARGGSGGGGGGGSASDASGGGGGGGGAGGYNKGGAGGDGNDGGAGGKGGKGGSGGEDGEYGAGGARGAGGGGNGGSGGKGGGYNSGLLNGAAGNSSFELASGGAGGLGRAPSVFEILKKEYGVHCGGGGGGGGNSGGGGAGGGGLKSTSSGCARVYRLW